MDLASFFALVADVGRDEALLLLLIRALRQRSGSFAFRVHDLAWMLRASNGHVLRWLDRLTKHRRVVYHAEELWGVDTVVVEIHLDPSVAAYAVQHHTLPTSWFFTLPLIGRPTFTCFLFLLTRESHDGLVRPTDVARAVGLRGHLHAAWHLRKLRRHGLLARHPHTGAVVLRDPPPLTRRQRIRLRYLAHPTLRRALGDVILLLVLLAAFVVGLALSAQQPPYLPLP
ncbi:MAG TPA: hypothetical protein VF883_23405 [Thermoanaerobaculia bacterium]